MDAAVPSVADRTAFSAEEYGRALFNILEDSNAEKQHLRENQSAIINILDDFALEKTRMHETQRAVLNILEDFSGERDRLQGSQRAILNILDDISFEKDRLQDTQRAVLNILEDFSGEKGRLQDSQRAVLNILDDISGEKDRLQDSQRAVLNILEDFAGERDRLQDTQKAVINILDDLQGEKQQLMSTQTALKSLAKDLENRVQQRTEALSRANAELQTGAERLSRASQYKSEFLANMSHELRTPLNSMLLLGRLLADNHAGNLNEKQVKCAQTIVGSGSDLLALINDILDLSKVEAGRMEAQFSEIHLDRLVTRLRDNFAPVAAQKSLQLTMTCDPDVPNQISTDGQRLEQVLKNLLSNAFKFTKVGRIGLRIRWAPGAGMTQEVSKRRLALSVTDTGIGIPDDKQKLIFEAFQQADGTTSRQFGGTGLGLSISSAFAELLGGSIQLDSTPGHGSCFTLTIPIVPAASVG